MNHGFLILYIVQIALPVRCIVAILAKSWRKRGVDLSGELDPEQPVLSA
jgi:hypothetical protein